VAGEHLSDWGKSAVTFLLPDALCRVSSDLDHNRRSHVETGSKVRRRAASIRAGRRGAAIDIAEVLPR